MAGASSKIGQTAFQVGSGCLLGIAVIVAVARVFARIRKEHRLYLDDAFFFLATICLVAGTTLIFIDIPYIYLQETVEAGLEMPPADFLTQLIHSEKIQDAATVLLATTIFSVKFSFLFFFRHLLRLQKKLIYYWWFICFIIVPSAAVFMFSDFISCDRFDASIVSECTTPAALARQNGTLLASAILDILTDCFLISVPILLLWNVQITVRRKLALCGILCLSVFMIIMAIIRVSTGKSINGQVDSAWVIFWLQAEASVAVMVVSVSAFRALFIAQKASRYKYQGSPGHRREDSHAKLWTAGARQDKCNQNLSTFGHVGVDTQISNPPLSDKLVGPSLGEVDLPLQGTRIIVTRDMSSEEKALHLPVAKAHLPTIRPSVESFV